MLPIPTKHVLPGLQRPLPEGLLLPFQHGRRWVALPQIIRLEGEGNYTNLFFTDGSALLVALSLKRLADRLPAGAFLRPHRKHLINRQYIEAVHKARFVVELTNGDTLEVSRRRITDFLHDYRRLT